VEASVLHRRILTEALGPGYYKQPYEPLGDSRGTPGNRYSIFARSLGHGDFNAQRGRSGSVEESCWQLSAEAPDPALGANLVGACELREAGLWFFGGRAAVRLRLLLGIRPPAAWYGPEGAAEALIPDSAERCRSPGSAAEALVALQKPW
jgi:hypothetical protein